ncbi:hypothetical protein [Novosphingobium sp.]|uniref:hypothetical protein n=1 Tax=Novosphingobium sp. TaxID=1874826 RepID=UPI0025E9AC46|nr:hypothetical protein [Novosphingobium sp.]
MDLTHIHTHLKRLFSSGGHDHAGNRIVWWQDREGEFAEELDKLDLENCHDDGVALIRLGEESTLALKVRMLLEEPKARFLIYERGALPDPAHDMLLDIRKWAAPFAADKSTLILRELGLIDELSLKSHIADRARFFASRERMDKLVRFIAPGDGAYQIDLKIMAVLARAPQPQLSQILRILLAELDPQELTADSKTLAEFQRFGVEQAFWDFVAQEFRYADEGPCLRNLLLRLFATDFARHVTGKVPVSLTHLVLPNGGGSNAIVFMDGWRDSSSHQRSYDALSAIIAEDLRIKSQLSGFALADLEMVHSFLDVEKRLASLLVREVLDASKRSMPRGSRISRAVARTLIGPTPRNRRPKMRPARRCIAFTTQSSMPAHFWRSRVKWVRMFAATPPLKRGNSTLIASTASTSSIACSARRQTWRKPRTGMFSKTCAAISRMCMATGIWPSWGICGPVRQRRNCCLPGICRTSSTSMISLPVRCSQFWMQTPVGASS